LFEIGTNGDLAHTFERLVSIHVRKVQLVSY